MQRNKPWDECVEFSSSRLKKLNWCFVANIYVGFLEIGARHFAGLFLKGFTYKAVDLTVWPK